jgi:transcriptional regulator with XRE-family HTH domain
MSRERKKPPLSPAQGARGEAVERLRKEKGFTQEELGALVYRDHQATGPIERGQANPTYLTLRRLAKALGTRPGKLLGLADEILDEEESGSSAADA